LNIGEGEIEMDEISNGQILTAVCFIGLLIFAQLLIKKNKSMIVDRWSLKKRINLVETCRLNSSERVQILKVDRTEYLYCFSKGNQPVIIPLNAAVTNSQHKNSELQAKPNTLRPRALQKKQKSNPASKEAPTKPPNKMLEAINVARKQNPKVSFR
jgi:flagellar biogenesis protein FliO